MTEIAEAIRDTKNNKSPGIDHMQYETFRNENSLRLLYCFYNKCFTKGEYPRTWGDAVITPVPKNRTGDQNDPLNYRGVSLLCCSAKIYSTILSRRLLKYFENFEILCDEQNGFRAKRSCLDHLYVVSTIVRNYKIKNKDVFACFVDMKKAFDLIDRNLLLAKLAISGIGGCMYVAIRAMYQRHRCCVKLNDFITNWFDVPTGVKQGDTLSTTLFSLYMNDLVTDINSTPGGISIDNETNINILLYADDIILMSDSPKYLQQKLDVLYMWCMKWKMAVNYDKTKIVHFRKLNVEVTNVNFKYGPDTIELVPQYKYLGCVLNEHLDYTVTSDILAKSGLRALGAVVNKLKTNNFMSYKVFSKLYKVNVVSIVDYCAGVWGFQNYDGPNRVHNIAQRYYLGVHKCTSLVMLQGDMAWVSPKTRRACDIIRLWCRLVNMPDTRITKKVFMWDKGQRSRCTWYYKVKQLFKDCDLLHLLELSNVRRQTVLPLFEKSLLEKDIELWKKELNNQTKLRVYRMFKTTLVSENYVNIKLPYYLRSILAQYRGGVLPLKIETGRFTDIPVHKRLCIFCNTNKVEDEIHFMFECAMYLKLRMVLYQHVFKLYPDFHNCSITEKLVIVLTDKRVITKTATYLYTAFNLRKQALCK